MKPTVTGVSLAVLALALQVPAARAQQHAHAAHGVPPSLEHEHQEIQAALGKATQAPGAVGSAARELQQVLQPHFEREEQIALPPLGVLQRLAAQHSVEDLEHWLLPMTDSLRDELPHMLREHVAIKQAVQKLERTATAANDRAAVHLAQQLAVHAQAEEEMYYPMAVLAGEIVRARMMRSH